MPVAAFGQTKNEFPLPSQQPLLQNWNKNRSLRLVVSCWEHHTADHMTLLGQRRYWQEGFF